MKNYVVEYCTTPYARCSSLEDAVALALAVHRSSNVPHVVCVMFGDVCQLTLKLDSVDE